MPRLRLQRLPLAVLLAVGVLGAARLVAQADYVVGAQDVLTINVWEQADLSGRFTVETDGTFTFPLIGRLKAGGLTLREVEAELRKRLTDGYFKNPQVSVTVDQYRSQRVFIVGEVRQPGTYPLTGDMTLIELLAKAGSTTDQAAGEALIVHARPGQTPSGPVLPTEGETAVERVDLKMLQSGTSLSTVPLRDGDTIVVPRAETVFVFGQVRNPGAYPIRQNMTVLQVLSLAGGISERGSAARIKIVRTIDGKKKEIKAKFEDLVQAGDTIMVPERFF